MSNFKRVFGLAFLVSGCQPMPPHVPYPTGRSSAAEPTALDGVVLSVERPRPEDSQSYVHVVLAPSDKQPIRLALAPGWYLDEQGIRYDPRQSLSVQGTRVVEDGKSTIVVRTVRQNERSYVLRGEDDRPAWLAP